MTASMRSVSPLKDLTYAIFEMSNPESTGLFDRAQRERRLCAVAMDDVQFLAFHQSTISAIGTEGLSGCSVVMITSQFGSILAHVPPRPSMANPQDLHAGDRNVRALMNRVANLYAQHRNNFAEADTFVVCALYAGNVALPDQKRIIEGNIAQMGLLSSGHFYDVPPDRSNPGQGTALIDSKDRVGRKPAVYLEDKLVSGAAQGRMQASTQQQTQPSTQQQTHIPSSEWVWDSTHFRYRRPVGITWEWS